MGTYSFQDVTATIIGFGGSINIGAGSGASEEGITIEASQDKNVMTIGADGQGQHSLIADRSSLVTVRLLKTSQGNSQLSLMYNLQTASASTHGTNTITVRDVARGDYIILTEAAFAKRPELTYAKEAGMNEWTFHAIITAQTLGTGTPEA